MTVAKKDIKKINVEDQKDPMVPLPFVVVDSWEEYPGCNTIVVKPADERGECVFKPGQFHMIHTFGVGEVPISNCSDESDTDSLTFTIMDVGEVSAALCNLKKDDQIGLRGPYGSAWPLEKAKGKDVVIVSGGLGLPPVRPIIYHILKNRDAYGKLTLIHGARTPSHLVYTDELKEWDERDDMECIVTVDDAYGYEWDGNLGLVTEYIKGLSLDPKNTLGITCGPEIMMKFAVAALQEHGLTSDDVYVSMERNMKCAIGHCGRCQYAPYFVCKDGPVFPFSGVERLFAIKEV